MTRSALVASLLLLACKTDPKPAPTPPSPSLATAPPAPVSPATPIGPTVAPIDRALLAEAAPTPGGAVELVALRFSDDHHAFQSWCMPGTDATSSAIEVSTALFKNGWSVDESRGDPTRAGISATRDGVTAAITLGGVDAKCKGIVANASYHTAAMIVPPVEPGERVH